MGNGIVTGTMEQQPRAPIEPPVQLLYLYNRWQKELAVPAGTMADRYRAEYEKEAGIYVAKLLKRV